MIVHLCTLDYTEKAMEAERRLKNGEQQYYCGNCNRWVWPEECQHEGRLTVKEFNAEWKRSAKEIAKLYPSERARSSAAWKKAVKEGKV